MPRKLIADSTNTASDSEMASCTRAARPRWAGRAGAAATSGPRPSSAPPRRRAARGPAGPSLRSTRANNGRLEGRDDGDHRQRAGAGDGRQADGEDQRREGQQQVEQPLEADVDGAWPACRAGPPPSPAGRRAARDEDDSRSVRMPYRVRDSRSRLTSSVPSRWAGLGASRFAAGIAPAARRGRAAGRAAPRARPARAARCRRARHPG